MLDLTTIPDTDDSDELDFELELAPASERSDTATLGGADTLEGFCTAISWTDDGITVGLRDSDNRFRRVLLAPDMQLALAVDGVRMCTGYRTGDGARVACPDQAAAEGRRGASCEACFRRNQGMSQSYFRGGELAAEVADTDRNTVVYLAGYANGQNRAATKNFMKVGTAGIHRVRERLAEQGARVALVIAITSEVEALRLEAAIRNMDRARQIVDPESSARRRTAAHDRRQVRDQLSQSDRLEAWTQKIDRELLIGELGRKLGEIHRRRPNPHLLPPDEVYEVEGLPELAALPPATKLVKPRELMLRGRISGIYGQTLIVERDTGETVALNARSLTGYKLRRLDDSEQSQDQLALCF
jgi:hypothetical protein